MVVLNLSSRKAGYKILSSKFQCLLYPLIVYCSFRDSERLSRIFYMFEFVNDVLELTIIDICGNLICSMGCDMVWESAFEEILLE